MGKTVNRMPASVDLPTSKQVKNYLFYNIFFFFKFGKV